MKLSPEIIKMRDALLERIGEKSLKEVAQVVNEILLNETNGTNRLAALAARVTVLRHYINKNYEVKNNSRNALLYDKEKNLTPIKEMVAEDNEQNKNKEIWVRVEMLKSGVVNGVRFPEGVVIDVNKDDADKLVEEKLSKIINLNEAKENEKVEAKEEEKVEVKENEKVEAKEEEKVEVKENEKVEAEEEKKVEVKENEKVEAEEEKKVEVKENEKVEAKEEEKVEVKENEKVEAKEEEKVEVKEKEKKAKKIDFNENDKENSNSINQKDSVAEGLDKKIIKTKSTKITQETIELTDPKAVAEALGLNKKKQEEDAPKEIEEEIDIEAIETGRKK